MFPRDFFVFRSEPTDSIHSIAAAPSQSHCLACSSDPQSRSPDAAVAADDAGCASATANDADVARADPSDDDCGDDDVVDEDDDGDYCRASDCQWRSSRQP